MFEGVHPVLLTSGLSVALPAPRWKSSFVYLAMGMERAVFGAPDIFVKYVSRVPATVVSTKFSIEKYGLVMVLVAFGAARVSIFDEFHTPTYTGVTFEGGVVGSFGNACLVATNPLILGG